MAKKKDENNKTDRPKSASRKVKRKKSVKAKNDVDKGSFKKSGRKTKFKPEKMKQIIRSQFPGKKPITKEQLQKYKRGGGVNINNVKLTIEQKRILKREKKIKFGLEQSVRSEVLLTEDSGFLEVNEDEITTQFSQTNIQNAVDPTSAAKRFDLVLKDFGPYRMNYTRNGRFLLLGGRKGHVAAIDWISKKLLCEINVMESTYDVAWLHQETLFAVAQKKWVYFYDNQGTEIHCVKQLDDVFRMTFLPYHFLLATVSNSGYLSWLDVSIGKMVQQFRIASHGTVSTVAQHPYNGFVCIGQPSGLINFWSPNNKKPAVTKWCHKQPISSIAFDPKGLKLATASVDRSLKIWDARQLTDPLEEYKLGSPANCLSFSHRGAMALGMGNMVEVYTDKLVDSNYEKKVYLRHKLVRNISNMEFCPFEDILGVAHASGFSSMLVPGSGEPNFDALEINPFQVKSQRKEREVQLLLGKIPSDLITWDPTELRKVDVPSLEEILQAKRDLMHIKPPNIRIDVKKKSGKQAGSVKAVQRKKIMKEEFKKKYVKEMKELRDSELPEEKSPAEKSTSVLDRFKPKKKS